MHLNRLSLFERIKGLASLVLCAGAVLAMSGAQTAHAVVAVATFSPALSVPVAPVPAGFDITGFIQEATLDSTGAICNPTNPRLAGGTVTLNGQKIVIPCNTVLQMPAGTLSWADLFNPGKGLAPTAIAPVGQTGLALGDLLGSTYGATIAATAPGLLSFKMRSDSSATLQTRSNASLPSYEIRVLGNVVNGRSIAGLVFISQQSLNAGQGRVSCIDYASGEMQVGGVPTDPSDGKACPVPAAVGVARVRLSDAIGRFGKRHAAIGKCAGAVNCVEEAGLDARFASDTDNPTVHATTG